MKIEIILKGEIKIMIEVTYKQMGDYQVPQVALPKTKNLPQGKYSMMRLKFLKEHKKGLYTELMMDGKMEEHLGQIEQTSQKRMKEIYPHSVIYALEHGEIEQYYIGYQEDSEDAE